jgi:hypothetical protein
MNGELETHVTSYLRFQIFRSSTNLFISKKKANAQVIEITTVALVITS